MTTAVLSPDIVALQGFCKRNPTCALLYSQHLVDNFTAFDELSRVYSTTAPFNLTQITSIMARPEVFVPYYLIAVATEPLCGPFQVWQEGKGCVETHPSELSSCTSCNILLGIGILIAVIIFIALVVVRVIKQLNAKKEEKIASEIKSVVLQKLVGAEYPANSLKHGAPPATNAGMTRRSSRADRHTLKRIGNAQTFINALHQPEGEAAHT